VPACTARASLRDHHVIYRSHGGDNARDNRVAICAAHHLNGIHRLRIRVSGVAPHDLTCEIGFRRGRPPLSPHARRPLSGHTLNRRTPRCLRAPRASPYDGAR